MFLDNHLWCFLITICDVSVVLLSCSSSIAPDVSWWVSWTISIAPDVSWWVSWTICDVSWVPSCNSCSRSSQWMSPRQRPISPLHSLPIHLYSTRALLFVVFLTNNRQLLCGCILFLLMRHVRGQLFMHWAIHMDSFLYVTVLTMETKSPAFWSICCSFSFANGSPMSVLHLIGLRLFTSGALRCVQATLSGPTSFGTM